MKLIVGIGNIGEKYINNRHNIGFVIMDKLQSEISNFQFPISNQISNSNFQLNKKLACYLLHTTSFILAKPTTMMNNSGLAVKKLSTVYRLQTTDIYVIHDDLDIKLGEYKIQFGKGPKVHNGIKSVDRALGTSKYWRVRVGVDNRTTDYGLQTTERQSGEDYVLGNFTREERGILDGVIERVVEEMMNKIPNLNDK